MEGLRFCNRNFSSNLSSLVINDSFSSSLIFFRTNMYLESTPFNDDFGKGFHVTSPHEGDMRMLFTLGAALGSGNKKVQ